MARWDDAMNFGLALFLAALVIVYLRSQGPMGLITTYLYQSSCEIDFSFKACLPFGGTSHLLYCISLTVDPLIFHILGTPMYSTRIHATALITDLSTILRSILKSTDIKNPEHP